MTVAPPEETNEPDASEAIEVPPARPTFERLVRAYFGTIFKNVVGWLCIGASPILGVLLPGPGGIPLFLVGFALVTFPGKRRLTTHVFRGRRLPIESPWFTGLVTFFSVLVTAGAMWSAGHFGEAILRRLPVLGRYAGGDAGKLVAIGAFALPVTMAVSWVGAWLLNRVVLRWVPGLRRFLRRTLRKYGVRLLPARRRRIGGRTEVVGNDEILGIDEAQKRRLSRAWRRYGPWLGRLATVSLTVFILAGVVAPVVREWPAVEARLGRLDPLRVLVGVLAFALGLLLFRTATWRATLAGFGRRLPRRAAARVWAIGHLVRFVPGRSYLAVRMELVRPYGPSATQANVAQRLEGTLALGAALAVGAVAFWWKGWEQLPALRPLWIALAAASPVALLLLTPRVFYRFVPDAIARRPGAHAGHAGRTRLRGGRLFALAAWQVAGVAWQAMAVWLLVGGPLAADGAWLAVAGAWSLAWAAGHLAGWAPGGVGVREVVFVGCLGVLLPEPLRDYMRLTFGSSTFLDSGFGGLVPGVPGGFFGLPALDGRAWQDVWWAFLFFLSLLLRLATTAAEVLYATLATALDWPAMAAFFRGDRPPAPPAATSGS